MRGEAKLLVARLDARLPDELPGPGSRVERLMELVGAYLSEETEEPPAANDAGRRLRARHERAVFV
jgi:hypothetical protein